MFVASGGAGRRTGVVLVVLALLTGLGWAAPSGAATRRTLSVSLARSAATVLTGDGVRLAGRVPLAGVGSPIRLQRATRSGWVTVRRGTVSRTRTFSFDLRPAAGTWTYRAYAPATSGHAAAASRRLRVRVLACGSGRAPRTRVEARFSVPHRRGASALARRLGQVFCAAAPGARIDIAMYFIRAVGRSADVHAILGPLERVARHRHVRVRILLEGRLYVRGASLSPSLRPLRSFARVILCRQGCHNERFEKEAPGSARCTTSS